MQASRILPVHPFNPSFQDPGHAFEEADRENRPVFFTLLKANRLIALDLDILEVFCSEIKDARLHNQVVHEHSQEFREGVPHGFHVYEPWTDARHDAYKQKNFADGKCCKCPYPLDPRSKRFCREHLMKEAENRDLHAARNPEKCRNCPEKRDPRSKRFCTFHLMKERKRDHERDVLRWQAQKKNAGVAKLGSAV